MQCKIQLVYLEAINTLVSVHRKELNVDYSRRVCSVQSYQLIRVLSSRCPHYSCSSRHNGPLRTVGLPGAGDTDLLRGGERSPALLALLRPEVEWRKHKTLHMHCVCVQEIYSPGHGRHKQAEERGHAL